MKKKIFLSIFLSLICLVSVFGFFGCDSAVKTLDQNFVKLDAEYEKYSDTFVATPGIEAKYGVRKVDFGSKIDGYVTNRRENFGDLDEYYNAAFVISNDYIDKYRDYVCNSLDENKLSKESKRNLDELNKSMSAYTSQISKFIKEKNAFVNHYENYEGTVTEETSLAYLAKFKKAFGQLVEKNIKFSTDLATLVESTRIYDILRSLTAPQPSDIEIVRNFVRARMLHLFTDFNLNEFSNKMTWSVQNDGDCKQRIDNLIAALNQQFQKFNQKFVLQQVPNEQDEESLDGKIAAILDYTNEFLLESKAYSKALKNIDFYTLAVKYKNKLQDYLKENKLAEVYLQKLEQFVSFTLPNFMDNVSKLIYN